jgi:hypothetical protein
VPPAASLLSAQFGSSFAFKGEDLRVPGVGIAPPEVGVEPSGEHRMVGVVAMARPRSCIEVPGGAVGGEQAEAGAMKMAWWDDPQWAMRSSIWRAGSR